MLPSQPDPFGRALYDHHRGERDEPLYARDGADVREHPVERLYFGAFAADGADGRFLETWLDGPLVDLGAGVGRHALYFGERIEVVAVEVSEHLVATMRDRGVQPVRLADMFALREAFGRDRFRSALAVGTQVGLAGSAGGLRRFLRDLAHVTTPDATAVLDCYDPAFDGEPDASDRLGYRPDPTPGVGHRVMQFEYDGDLGRPLYFRLFSPDRLREAAMGTGWRVAAVERGPAAGPHYHAALESR